MNLEEGNEENRKIQKNVDHNAALSHSHILIDHLEEDTSLCDKSVLKKTVLQRAKTQEQLFPS